MTLTFRSPSISVSVMVVLIRFSHSLYGADPTDQSILKKLRAADTAALSSYTLTFEKDEPVNVLFPDQGTSTRSCTMTKTGDAWALDCDTVHNPPIHYRPPPPHAPGYEPMDYNDGNLIVWRLDSIKTLVDGSMNETYYEYEGLTVDPNGRVVQEGVSLMRSVYNLSDRQNWYEMERCCWAAGYGFSSNLETIVEHRVAEDGMIHLRASGSHSPSSRGIWEMTIDPQNGMIARSATFTVEGSDSPSVICATTGTKRFDDVIIARTGRIVFPIGPPTHHLQYRFRFSQFEGRPDGALLKRISAEILGASARGDVQLMDYRQQPDRPTRTWNPPKRNR